MALGPKMAQELARHSDIGLTMHVYTHAQLHDLGAAVQSLPALLSTSESFATGTHGAQPGESLRHG
jgi:hypothetical protein